MQLLPDSIDPEIAPRQHECFRQLLGLLRERPGISVGSAAALLVSECESDLAPSTRRKVIHAARAGGFIEAVFASRRVEIRLSHLGQLYLDDQLVVRSEKSPQLSSSEAVK